MASSVSFRQLAAFSFCRDASILGLVTLVIVTNNCVARQTAQLYGGIEIGAQGIKRLVVEIPADGTKARATTVPGAGASQNIGLASALEASDKGGKRFSKEATEIALKVVERFKHDLVTDFHVPPEHVVIAVSSGLAGAAKGAGGDDKALKSFEHAIRQRCMIDPVVVDAKTEAHLTFVGVVPDASERRHALLIDVGGGNTKVACASLEGGIPFGARTLADLRSKVESAKADEAADKAIDAVFQKVAAGSDDGRTVYITGGCAYITASFVQPVEVANSPRSLHNIPVGQLRGFLETLMVSHSISQVFDERIERLRRDGNERAAQNLLNAQKIYDIKRLRAGVWLLERTLARLNVQVAVFDGDSETAWLRGLVIDLANKQLHK